MSKIFDNVNALPAPIIRQRLSSLSEVEIIVYSAEKEDGTLAHYIGVESTATDESIESLLGPMSAGEQDELTQAQTTRQLVVAEYQSTMDTLAQIENADSLTNAQFLAAVKFTAKTIRRLIRLYVRFNL